MSNFTLSEAFVSQLTACQSRVYAYITAMVHDAAVAQDILQETNLVLCRKASTVTRDMDFVGWACRTAYFQVLAYRRDAGRDKLLFDDGLIEQLAERAATRSGAFEDRRMALRRCMSTLSQSQRDLLIRRYTDGEPVHRLAASLDRPAGSIAQTLHRIRKTLLECIERRLNEPESQ